jgi:hypothetical protein
VIELLRKFALFMLLFIVVMGTYLAAENSTDWREPLWVQVYPINGDDRKATQKYINQLEVSDFLAIEKFMKNQSERYSVNIDRPVKLILGEELHELPPALGKQPNVLNVMLWSLKLRWWAHSATTDQPGPAPDVRLFLVYFDPISSPTLGHSIGLQKGLIGVINVFALRSQSETNNFVIAHEMLHTLGASDKYDLRNNQPLHPHGYADPERTPLYPQVQAEVMGGRIPLSPGESVIPRKLKETVVGPATAEEIRWLSES